MFQLHVYLDSYIRQVVELAENLTWEPSSCLQCRCAGWCCGWEVL